LTALDWELREHGAADAAQTVLLLPGGMCSAGSFAELMAEPSLADLRLVAATLPGQTGAAPLDDCSVESYARVVSELAEQVGADIVLGFSMGAVVAVEMVVSGAFAGPVVLLGVSLSRKDEPWFFRALVRLGAGGLLAKAAASMVKRIPVSAERQAELRADFRRNVSADAQQSLRSYLAWLGRGEGRAQRLCEAGAPGWVVHAEKGDGGLTDEERRTLEACPHIRLVTIPGHVFFLPNEVPGRIADVLVQAAGRD
jgi:pimeloyl-ACP methyl ester carboxylesterase